MKLCELEENGQYVHWKNAAVELLCFNQPDMKRCSISDMKRCSLVHSPSDSPEVNQQPMHQQPVHQQPVEESDGNGVIELSSDDSADECSNPPVGTTRAAALKQRNQEAEEDPIEISDSDDDRCPSQLCSCQ